MAQSSKIYVRNRALGYVSNHIPLVIRYIRSRKENLVVTCVGKSFHTYGCSRFTLLSVSGVHPDDITCISADTFHIFTASDNVVRAWRRGTELKHTYAGHTRPIHLLLPFGPHLLSVDEDSNLKIWDIKAEELYLELTFDNTTFEITTLLHPSTYVNKILLGSDQGQLQLWNIHTSKLIYTFHGWGSAVTVLEQAPAIDVVAIGLANGHIIVHNIKYDQTVMEFIQDWGLVTSLSFRTDGPPILASGSLAGHMVFWDLEERKVASQLLSAHNGSVSGMKCLPNEPLIVTSSPDNTLKMWIFDMPDGGARLLRYREGHGAPPTSVRFHGNNGHNLLSSGGDSSLRIFSTLTETFNKSLGLASYNRKASKKKGRTDEDPLRMPPILSFTSETTREKEWDNVAATHSGLALVTTWSYDKVRMGNIKLLPDRFDPRNKDRIQATATSICLTKCGNFVVIGYSTGHVDRFNIQSGIHRETYGQPTAHVGAVRGITTDGLNKLTITGGSDAHIKFWPFKSSKAQPLSSLQLDEPVSFFTAHHDSSIIAVALEDFTLVVIDLDSRTIIRKFQGHSNQLTDATFSPDSRWLITAAMDCTIRTWDIPSGQLVDCFQVDAACTSLSFSPTGDLLATAHVNYLGVFLWSNRTLYSHVSLRALPESSEIPLVTLPSSVGDDAQESSEGVSDFQDEDVAFKSSEQIHADLVTLSAIANSRWQNLLDIDIVKKRNKPIEPPKTPKAAPFFLPTVPSLQLQFDLSDKAQSDGSPSLPSSMLSSLTVFGKLLDTAPDTPNGFQLATEKLKSLGPSAIDFEVSSLAPEGGGSIVLMLKFMQLIEFVLTSKKDFEIVQAYLGLFLKKHGDAIIENHELREQLQMIQSCQLTGWTSLEDKLLFNMSIVQSLKTM